MVRTLCYPDFLRKRIPSPNPDHYTFQEQLQYIKASFYFDYDTAYEILLELTSSARDKDIKIFPPSQHRITINKGYIFLQYQYFNSPIQSIEIRYQHNTLNITNHPAPPPSRPYQPRTPRHLLLPQSEPNDTSTDTSTN